MEVIIEILGYICIRIKVAVLNFKIALKGKQVNKFNFINPVLFPQL